MCEMVHAGRRPGDRQRRGHHHRRPGRQLRAERDDAGHGLQPAPVASRSWPTPLACSRTEVRRRHRGRPGALRGAGGVSLAMVTSLVPASATTRRPGSPRKPSAPGGPCANWFATGDCSRTTSWTGCWTRRSMTWSPRSRADGTRRPGGDWGWRRAQGRPAAASSQPLRPSMDEYFMGCRGRGGPLDPRRRAVGRSSCATDRILATGYNGSPPGFPTAPMWGA